VSINLKNFIMREEKHSNCDKPETRKKTAYPGIIFAAVFILSLAFLTSGCSKSSVYDPAIGDPLKANIELIVPTNLADSVFVDPLVSVTFKPEIDPDVITSTSITLKKGTVVIPGTVTVSGTTASFTTVADLLPESEYTATVTTIPIAGSGSSATHEYSWRFKTGKKHRIGSLAVVSVSPTDKATQIAVASPLLVTFNQELSASMRSSVAVSLKKGTAAVNGGVVFSGKTATFQPSAALDANSLYTGKVFIAAYPGETVNNAGKSFNWSFTTNGSGADVTAPTISSVVPTNNATSVATTTKATVTFSEAMNPATITAATFTLKQGSTVVSGAVSYTGTTATFTPTAALTAGLVYTGTISTGVKDIAGNALAAAYVWSFTTVSGPDLTAPTVLSVVPLNAATSASTTTKVTVTFSEAMNATTINSASFTLKQGSTSVAGTVTYSGTTATFSPTAALAANTAYTGTITTAVKDVAGNALAVSYTWSFTTAAVADVTPPTVLSVVPAANATSVASGVKVTATFSEAMDAATISATTFTLKQGSTAVAGTVSYTGTTATFTPSAALAGSTVYTSTITTGAKDVSGNALSAAYAWSFTTAVPSDVTPPTVLSVTPANSATSVAVNSAATVTFSEAMSSASITTSTFTLKQGTSSVAGTVTYSGTTATFTPSAALAGGTVYTASITTGVKDAAGNSLAAVYTWSFTTVVTAPAGKSFSADVVPILNLCNTCHTHGWTPSTNASTFYTNLVNSGYVNAASPTTSKIYSKIGGGGHPPSTVSAAQVNTIITWMNEGSKNN
jgi:hypothetical protein